MIHRWYCIVICLHTDKAGSREATAVYSDSIFIRTAKAVSLWERVIMRLTPKSCFV